MKKEAHNEPLFFSKLGGHDGELNPVSKKTLELLLRCLCSFRFYRRTFVRLPGSSAHLPTVLFSLPKSCFVANGKAVHYKTSLLK